MWKKIKDSKTHTYTGEKFKYAYSTELKTLLIKNLFEPELIVALPIKNLRTAKEIVKLIED
jgi:hypothetical protein